MQNAWIAVGFIAVVAAVAAALTFAQRVQTATEGIWREFARKSGHRWCDASGPWYRRQRAHVEGELAHMPFTLERHVVHHGKSSTTYTRVRIHLARPLAERVIVRPRNRWLGALDRLFQQPIVELGDARFDERMLVRCGSRELARKVLDDGTRRRLLATPRALRLEAQDDLLMLRWRGAERDPSVLAAAVELASGVAVSAART